VAQRVVGLALAACEKTVQIVYEHNLRPEDEQGNEGTALGRPFNQRGDRGAHKVRAVRALGIARQRAAALGTEPQNAGNSARGASAATRWPPQTPPRGLTPRPTRARLRPRAIL
jgi:hypothetical protein